MGFSPPNYTQTPNDFFDQIAKTLKEGELRVLLMIMRQTFGWRKSWDRISLGQLEEKTGMCRDAVNNALKSLVAKGLVLKRKEGKIGQEKCWYSLETEHVEEEKEIPDTESDLPPDSNSFYQSSKTTPDQSSLTTTPSRFRRPTKETTTKEKEITTPTPSKGDGVREIFEPLESFGKFVKLERGEYVSFCREHGEAVVKDLIEQINDYLASSGKKPYRDYAAALRQWLRRRKENPPANSGSKGTTAEVDKEFAEKIISKFPRERDIKLGSNYIEFNFGPMNVPHIKFGDKAFREQLLHNLRKMNLSTEGL